MKKWTAILLAFAMTMTFAMPAAAESGVEAVNDGVDHTQGETLTWILPQTLTEEHPALQSSYAFADAMKEATDGRWTVEVYAGGSMGSENETIEMCRANTIQIVPSNLTTMEQYVPDFGVFALPYLFHNWEDFSDYLSNSEKCKALWNTLEEATGLHFVSCVANGARCLSTKGIDPIKGPADLKGVKIRSMEAPVWQNIISCLGGSPIAISFTELYVALQTGVVNGQDNPLAIMYANKFYEVTDDFYFTNHCYNTSAYFVSSEAWNALSEEDQLLFTDLWQKYMVDYYDEIFPDYEQIALDAVEKAGVTIWQQEDLDMQAFYDSAAEMIDREYMSNETYAGYINDINTRYGY